MNRLDASPLIPSTRCSSLPAPRVSNDNTGVCPRVNSPEPCVRGAIPVSTDIGLFSSSARPSGRTLSTAMRRLMTCFSTASKAFAILAACSVASGRSSAGLRAAITCSLTPPTASERSFFSSLDTAVNISSAKRALILSTKSGSAVRGANSILGTPTSRTHSSIAATCFLIASCATSSPATTSSSETSRHPASTMLMASAEPDTMISIGLTSLSASVGLTTQDPSTLPNLSVPSGPWKGALEMDRAADAPSMASVSYGFTPSTESTVATICVSLLNPSGHIGRIGLSIKRAFRMASSLGRPSFFMNPPGIFPAAYMPSSISTVRGKKSTFLSDLETTAVTRTIVSPDLTTTEPLACLARRPVSSVISLSPTVIFLVLTCEPPTTFIVVSSLIQHSLHSAPRVLLEAHHIVRYLTSTHYNYSFQLLAQTQLFAQTQLLDQRPIPPHIFTLQIAQEAATLPHHLQQPSSRVMVLLVFLKVLCQNVNLFCEECSLYLWRAGIALMLTELINEFLLAFLA